MMFFMFFTNCFWSRLLQICCMWKRVNIVEIFIVSGNNEHFLLCHNVSKVVCCGCVNPFQHTTNPQQTTLKVSLEKLYKCRYDNRRKLKTLCQKEKLLFLINFFFCRNVFTNLSAAEALESVYMRERVNFVPFLNRLLLCRKCHSKRVQWSAYRNYI